MILQHTLIKRKLQLIQNTVYMHVTFVAAWSLREDSFIQLNSEISDSQVKFINTEKVTEV